MDPPRRPLRDVELHTSCRGRREGHESPRPVRQAEPARRQAMFRLAGHLAECKLISVGKEHRIVAEPHAAARRPDQGPVHPALKCLQMAVRPGHAERRDEVRSPGRRGRRALCAQAVFDLPHRGSKILGRPGPARRVDARRSAERFDHQPGIVGERRQPRRHGRRHGLDAGILAKARAGFLRLAEAELGGRNGVNPIRREQLPHLAQFAGIVGRDHQATGDPAMVRPMRVSQAHITAIFCKSMSLPTPLRAERQQRQQLHLGERRLFRRALDFHDAAAACEHEIGVGVGAGVLRIVEVEHRRPGTDAARNGGDVLAQRHAPQHVRSSSRLAAYRCNPRPGDRGRAGAAIGLEYVAIDGDLASRRALRESATARRLRPISR